VRASINLLLEGRVDYEFRITVVPGYHGPENIEQLAHDLSGAARLRLQNFNPEAPTLDPALKTVTPFTQEDLKSLQLRVDELLFAARPPLATPRTTATWQ
jgi:pyruvate formate lyase activating enzyme